MSVKKRHKSRLKPGQASLNTLFRKYQYKSRKRNITWNLTKGEFGKITKKDCFYCGVPPLQSEGANRTCRHNGPYIYNGIDRADSLIGYTVSNSRPCCKRCNMMKSNMSVMEFKRHMRVILKRLTL